MTPVAADPMHVHSLHRYFVSGDRMRTHFDHLLALKHDGKKRRHHDIETNIYMSYWYGLLYVVIEGWRELGLADPVIDALLESPMVDLIRRYRNGAFHFQRDFYDDRFMGFIAAEGAAEWVRTLNKELGRWFLDWMAPIKAHTSG